MGNSLVIVYKDGKACVLLNGKAIGRGVERIKFDMEAAGDASIDFGPMDLKRETFGPMEEFQAVARRMGFDIKPVGEETASDIFGETNKRSQKSKDTIKVTLDGREVAKMVQAHVNEVKKESRGVLLL